MSAFLFLPFASFDGYPILGCAFEDVDHATLHDLNHLLERRVVIVQIMDRVILLIDLAVFE